jgi:hypothetical protein
MQTSLVAELHQQKEVVVLDEDGVKLNDVGMVNETLDLDLAYALREHCCIVSEEGVLNAFEGTNETGSLVAE